MSVVEDLCTVVYLKQEHESDIWEREFLDCFKGSGFVPVKHPGILGDVQTARIASLKDVDTKYVIALDYDDIVVPETLVKAIRFLEDNEDYVACTANEGRTGSKGILQEPSTIHDSVDMAIMVTDPTHVHAFTVLRTEVVKEVLPTFEHHNFYHFDWALRLMVAGKGKIGMIPGVGLYYRRHAQGHSAGYRPDHLVPSGRTYIYLKEHGLVNF